MNNKLINSILIIVSIICIIISVGCIYIQNDATEENKKLQQTIENKNKLIKILEVSCECECEENITYKNIKQKN